jgi:hypothetical protein
MLTAVRQVKEIPVNSQDSAVPERLTLFMLFVLFLTGCDVQSGARSFTYKLHNPQNDGQYSTLHLMPDGGLLMVSKRFTNPSKSGICCASRTGTLRNRGRTSWMWTWGRTKNYTVPSVGRIREMDMIGTISF